MITRREFLDALAVGAAGVAASTTAKSYGQILGANDRVAFAVIGLNGRAYAHLSFVASAAEIALDRLPWQCSSRFCTPLASLRGHVRTGGSARCHTYRFALQS